MAIVWGVGTGFLRKIEQHFLHATLAVGLDRCGRLDGWKATAAHRLSVGRKPGAAGTDGKQRLSFSAAQKKRLALKAKAVGLRRLKEIAGAATPQS